MGVDNHTLKDEPDQTETPGAEDLKIPGNTFAEEVGDSLANAILDSLPDVLVVFDLEGRFIRWNKRVSEYTGYSDEELASMNITSLLAEQSIPAAVESFQKILDEGRVGPFEIKGVTKSGEKLDYELSGSLLRDRQGNPIGVCGVGRDITYRKAAEESASESRQRFRALVEATSDWVWEVDIQGFYTYASPKIKELLGYEPREVIGMKPFDMMPQGEAERIAVEFNAIKETAHPFRRLENVNLHKDGRRVVLETSGVPVFNENGELVGYRGIDRDITDRKRSEELVRSSQAKLRALLNAIPDMMFRVDADGTYLEFIPADDMSPAVPPTTFLGRKVNEVMPSGLAETFTTVVKRVISTGNAETMEYRLPASLPDGEVRDYESRIVKSGAGEALAIVRDITPDKLAEQELIRLNQELDGYAQTVSHDLRTPLTSIKLAVESLQRTLARENNAPDLETELMRSLEIIHISTSKAEAFIDDLLELARAGQEPMVISDVDVNETVEIVLEENAGAIDEKGISVLVDTDLGNVRANPTHIYQIFSNLIGNAVKYNNTEEPLVEIRRTESESNSKHSFVVRDNGPGIPEEEADKIFLPFYRSEKRNTGIGLAITTKLVKLYNGMVKAYNDGGACFEFFIMDHPGG